MSFFRSKRQIFWFTYELVLAVLLLVFYFWKPFTRTYGSFTFTATQSYICTLLVGRALAGLLFLGLLLYMAYPVFRMHAPKWFLLFPFLVAINNFPFEAVARGKASLNGMPLEILGLLGASFAVAFFEELAFRGLFTSALLERFHRDRRQILLVVLLSSVLFGLVHLLNLFEGAGPGDTFMQVGYSILIGAMCALVLLETGSVIWCILLHGLYDFAGMLLPTLGTGSWFYPLTIVLTVVLGLATAAVLLLVFFRMTPEQLTAVCRRRKFE